LVVSVGLARSDTSAAALAASGAEVHRGTLDDLDSLRAGAAASYGVIHTAYKHDIAFSGDFQGAGDADRRAIKTLGEALVGSDRPLVIASGTAGLTPGVAGTEEDAPDRDLAVWPRIASEHAALSLAARGVRSSAVRSAPSVHGQGDHGFVPTLIDIARDKAVSGYIGDATNRWAAVHRRDATALPTGLGDGSGGIGAARGRRRGRADPRHRRGDRPPSEAAGGLHPP
jgi:hypothetical protein